MIRDTIVHLVHPILQWLFLLPYFESRSADIFSKFLPRTSAVGVLSNLVITLQYQFKGLCKYRQPVFVLQTEVIEFVSRL